MMSISSSSRRRSYHTALWVVAVVVTIIIDPSSAWTIPALRGLTNRKQVPSPSLSDKVLSTISTSSSKAGLNAIAIPQQQQQQQQSIGVDSTAAGTLDPQDEWIAKLDYEGFGKEVTALGKELQKDGGIDDVKHLNKILSWRNAAAIIGLATIWMTPNPLTIAALSTWTYSSWTIIAHHTCHGGYNRITDAGNKYNSRGFALGTLGRRFKDWLDWMLPEAWNIEHNRLHHYRLNEDDDPDLVQRNMNTMRNSERPMIFKYVTVFILASMWKWFYYAPNTFKELQTAKWMKENNGQLPKGFDSTQAVVLKSLLFPVDDSERALQQVVKPKEFFMKVMAPFFIFRFILIPAPLLVVPGIGPLLFKNAIINMLLAEILTNLHAFLTIVTNHAGEDLYTFDDAVKPRSSSFYVRQVIGSANYEYGNDITDFSHGWLNYQIEHHVWPDFSILQYQKAAPRLKMICDKYGVPYIKESVWTRLRKTVDVMIGKTTMRSFPTQYEPIKDKAGIQGVTWKNDHGSIDD